MSAVLAMDRWAWDLFVGLERFAVHEPHGRRQRRLSLFLLACIGLGVELCMSRIDKKCMETEAGKGRELGAGKLL